MFNKLENLKKRLIYRASYRGTKEMDILLGTFVNKFINTFDEEQLNELENFLNFDDELILNYYHNEIVNNNIDQNKVSKIFKNFKI
jgi:antitoxin CptB|tara:strand:- start:9 stop:266 length:258 start_codon:yes stop_codon:yes gene_type:complete